MKTPRTPWPHAPLHPEGRLSFHVLCARDLLILFCRHGLVTSRTAKQARVIPNTQMIVAITSTPADASKGPPGLRYPPYNDVPNKPNPLDIIRSEGKKMSRARIYLAIFHRRVRCNQRAARRHIT